MNSTSKNSNDNGRINVDNNNRLLKYEASEELLDIDWVRPFTNESNDFDVESDDDDDEEEEEEDDEDGVTDTDDDDDIFAKVNGFNLEQRRLIPFPTQIWSSPSFRNQHIMRSLLVWYCPHRILPSGIGNLTTLTYLNIAYCRFHKLPSSLGSLQNLETLDIEHCPGITRLPSSIGSLHKLKNLDITNCKRLKRLPAEIGNLISLRRLFLQKCTSIKEIPPSIGNLVALEDLTTSSSNVIEYPPSIFVNMKSLKELDCTFTNVTQIPPSIRNLEALEALSIENCKSLHSFPMEIERLQSLKRLFVGGYEYSEMPRSILNLRGLEELTMYGCDFPELSPSICSLKKLKVLQASYSSTLNKVPRQIGQCVNLERLELINNDWPSLPPEIGKLKRLKTVILEYVEHVPFQLFMIGSLKSIIIKQSMKIEFPPQRLQSPLVNLEVLVNTEFESVVNLPNDITSKFAPNLKRLFVCNDDGRMKAAKVVAKRLKSTWRKCISRKADNRKASSAVRIQTFFRSSLGRRRSATKIQQYWRGFLSRRRYGDIIKASFQEWKLVYQQWNPVLNFIVDAKKKVVGSKKNDVDSLLFSWQNLKEKSFDFGQTDDGQDQIDKETTDHIMNAAREGIEMVKNNDKENDNPSNNKKMKMGTLPLTQKSFSSSSDLIGGSIASRDVSTSATCKVPSTSNCDPILPYYECHELLSDKYDNILLSQATLKWFKNVDPKYQRIFLRRLKQFANGEFERSYKLRKRLTGSKHIIYEAYLEQKVAYRIIFTECRSKEESKEETKCILVWYVSTHGKVPRCIKQINETEERMDRQFKTSASSLLGDDDNGNKHGISMALDNDTILLDPFGTTPLKIHQLKSSQIDMLKLGAWTPPFRLTNDEKKIVSKPGNVLLLGRSGTGKTVCIVNRMVFDADFYGSSNHVPLKQLFISRSRKIKDLVQRLVDEVKQVDDNLERSFVSYERIIRDCESALTRLGFPPDVAAMREPTQQIIYSDFKKFFVTIKKGAKSELTALVIWTQIRTFLKGGIEAVMNGRPLTLMEYLGLGLKYCRLSRDHRREVFAVYKLYASWLESNGYYDSCDRIADILNRIRRVSLEKRAESKILFDKIYIDECQDFTSSDFALFWTLCQGGGNLFLAGDTAQNVEHGISFRFDDVKRVFFEMGKRDCCAGGSGVPSNPLTIKINFRSHSGILEMAAAVLMTLHNAFPGAADKLQDDEGLFRGPRPSILCCNQGNFLCLDTLREIVLKNPSLVVLTPDENTSTLKQQLGTVVDGLVILGICEAKGLDFDEVVIVDFFSTVSTKIEKAWKLLFRKAMNAFNTKGDLDFQSKFPELEMRLKLLYTAITRCRHRLFFVETKQSPSYEAFSRWVLGEDLIEKQDVKDFSVQLKSADEWRSLGIEYAISGEGQDNSVEDVKAWFKRASMCFEQANDICLLKKAKSQLILRSQAIKILSNNIKWEDLQKKVAVHALECLEFGGFIDEAKSICEILLDQCPLRETKVKDAVCKVLCEMKTARDLIM